MRGRSILRVLNARRHRDGDQAGVSSTATTVAECSTPEGIETVIRTRHLPPHFAMTACSTPEGIETVIRQALAHEIGSAYACSTPEGIETVIRLLSLFLSSCCLGAQRPKASRR